VSGKRGEPSAKSLLLIDRLNDELLAAIRPLAERYADDHGAQCIIANKCLHVGIATLASYRISPADMVRTITQMVEELRTTGNITMYAVPANMQEDLTRKGTTQ
jgi:hypothetical protein